MTDLKDIIQFAIDNPDKVEELMPLVVKPAPVTNFQRVFNPLQDGDTYYFIGIDGDVLKDVWEDGSWDYERLDVGNVYLTREHAEAVVAKRKLLQKVWQEEGALPEHDWEDDCQANHSLYYDHINIVWGTTCWWTCQHHDWPVFESEEAAKAVIKKYGSELHLLLVV